MFYNGTKIEISIGDIVLAQPSQQPSIPVKEIIGIIIDFDSNSVFVQSDRMILINPHHIITEVDHDIYECYISGISLIKSVRHQI